MGKPGGRRIRRAFFSVVRIVVLSGLGAGLLLFFLQSRLVYMPSREMTVTPRDAGLGYEEISFRAGDGVGLNGWYVPAENARATVLLCHGNGGNISDRLDTLHVMNEMGLNTFIFDYRGYGKSEGKPTEAGTYEDAEAAWKQLTEVRGIAAGRIVIVGHSLGGAIAAHLAREHAPGALVLESTFTSIAEMGSHLYPWLPVRWLLRFKYDTAECIAGHKYPLLVIHSREDEVVPFRLGRKLYEGAGEPKEFLEISGGHDDGFETSGKVYTEGWRRFLDKYLPAETGNRPEKEAGK